MTSNIVLVTAFEPFGGEAVNASLEAAKGLDGRRCGDAVVAVRTLPCAYDLCVADLVAACERLRPSAVLMSGQAARRGVLCVERCARNRVSASRRDSRGALGSPALGPDMLETTADAAAVARAVRTAGVAARVSADAGDYVCNHLYFEALRRLGRTSPTVPAIFIHLPATPAQSPPRANARRLDSADAMRGLEAAIQAMLRPIRRTDAETPPLGEAAQDAARSWP